MLAVLAKRTYNLLDSGRCVLAEEQLPLQQEILTDPHDRDLMIADSDLFPYKPATDVVVRGFGRTGVRQREFVVSVQVGGATKSLLAIGERRAALSSSGRLVFSEPAFFEEISLRYDHAYGGRDEIAEARYGLPAESFKEYLPEHLSPKDLSPYCYPRNPCGKGYLITATPDAVERVELPQLEDVIDRLSPDRLPLGRPEAWLLMPLPQAFDWVHFGWFPRVAYFGVLPLFDAIDVPVAEVTRGFAPADILQDAPLQDKFSLRVANGASVGLQLSYLAGDEECRLEKIHPKYSSFVFRLPGERPRISVDGRNGTLKNTEPVLHTVLIEPDENRVSIVWRGAAQALRPYLPEELAKMPLRVDW